MDPDAGENGTLIYRILSSFPEDHFTIDCEKTSFNEL